MGLREQLVLDFDALTRSGRQQTEQSYDHGVQVVRFEGAMVPREQLFWNLTLQHLLLGCADDAAVAAVFERLAVNAVRA